MVIKSKLCHYDGIKQYNGIFQYIVNITNKVDPLESGIFNVTASLAPEKTKYLFKETTISEYYTSKGLNNYILIDFKENRVKITGYTFYAATWDFLKEWDVYGSNNNDTWIPLDHQTLASSPTSSGSMVYLVFNALNAVKCRFLKFVNTGTRVNGEDYYVLHRIELFGIFYSSKDQKITCKQKLHNSSIISYYLLILLSKR